MEHKSHCFLFVYLLLLLTSLVGSTNPSPAYKQQVVLILDDDSHVHKAGAVLYKSHDTSSHVLMWNSITQTFQPVEWNENTAFYEVIPDPSGKGLPIGPQKTFSWSDTVIQVVGHGNNIKDERSPVISGFTAEMLARVIFGELASGDVGRIDIIGSTSISHEPASQQPVFLEQFMLTLRELRRFGTTATLRSNLVAVDHSGREISGQLLFGVANKTDFEWRHTSPPEVWIGQFTGENYQVLLSPSIELNLNSPYFGILPETVDVYVTDYQHSHPSTYTVPNDKAFQWIDHVAQKTFSSIRKGRAPSVVRQVQFLSGDQEVKDVPVIEIGNMEDFLKELRHYGEKGPAEHNSEVYIRFGPWVLSLYESTFYVSVVGIVTSPSDSIAEKALVQNIVNQWQMIPDLYPNMQPNTNDGFFKYVPLWINGHHDSIPLNLEDAYNAQCGVAMFFSEAIRSFHVHVTNMMSLHLAQHGYLTREYFFSSHPMARKGSWQITDPRTGKKKTGLNLLRDAIQNEAVLRVSRVTKSWLSHVDSSTVMGSRDVPPATRLEHTTSSHLASILSFVEDIASTAPVSHDYLREYELKESSYRLLSSNISEPETGTIDTQVEDFSLIDDKTLPLKAYIALANDHAYVSDLMRRELQQRQVQTGKVYEVIPDSVEVEDQSDIVRFFVREVSNVSSELEQITTTFDKSQLSAKALLEKLLSELDATNPIVSWIKRVEGAKAAVVGIVSSVHELESGNPLDALKGVYDLANNVMKLGDIFGIDKAAGKYLGKVLDGLDKIDLAKNIVKLASSEDEVLSVMGDVDELDTEFLPIVGGLLSFCVDFSKHTIIGYVDAAFDIGITALSALGDEALPFEVALSLIKMGIDYIYNFLSADISKELQALPPNPSIGQVVGAVIEGILDAIADIINDLIQNLDIFATIDSVLKLDRQYATDQEFLQNMSKYSNYYNVVHENGSNSSEINFATGQESWNGGDITFHLGEDGHSTMTLETVDSNYGNQIVQTYGVETGGVEDIVLGIGESHKISFKQVTVRFLWFIPVDTKRVISGVTGEKQTLHGTYYGNSQNNKFIAVQELPPNDLTYNLHDYHYKLYGGGGNDSFYLGPQQTYVEGNEGSDTYFINSTSTFTEINSHSGDGQQDTMIINLNYDQIYARRDGHNLILISSNTHKIVIINWFYDATHQRMVFKTKDGVLFKVSATITEEVALIPYALSGSSATRAQVYDARLPQFTEVFAIAGSEHDDIIYGNDLDNKLNGAGGHDQLMGGEGKDTYTVDLDKGIDTINNFAMGGEMDTLVIGARLDQLVFSSSEGSDDLHITHTVANSTGDSVKQSNTGAIVRKWFSNETYRHMIVVTQDQSVVKVSAVRNSTVSYQHLIINMTHIEEEVLDGSEVYTRKLDLNSDRVYSDVLTVFGTPSNDFIIGNGRDNYITGAQGFDRMEGREGADKYIVKEREGRKIIMNCAKDTNVDTLIFAATFDDILLSRGSQNHLILAAGGDIEVTLQWWFNGSQCQHLVVRSADGVTFALPNTTSKGPLEKTAKSIDNSNLTSDVDLNLSGKWEEVERVIGSKGADTILGNSLDNYIDPGLGDCHLQGGNGSDTYVIRSTYGDNNVIDNYAEDDRTDTILFLVPFLTIQAEVVGMNTHLTSLSGDGLVGITIMDYNNRAEDHARHLTVTTSDGISFVLPIANSSNNNNYKPIPVSINMAHAGTGQHMHLTAYPDFYQVRSVYGSTRYQNSMIGNALNNTLVGGDKPDLLQGQEGDDVLKGGDGNDVIEGGPGADTLDGGDGDDHLDGGDHDDIISPGTGTNQVDGGPGTDTVIYSGEVVNKGGITVDLSLRTCIHHGNFQDTLNSIENAYGTEFDDILHGDDKDNVLVGQGGSDHLTPGSGYDILNGGEGNDTYDLSKANGTVIIENYAKDDLWDMVIMSYTNISSLWYEIFGDDVVLRVINDQYPVFYDGGKPAVVFKSFMVNPRYRHCYMEMADGSVISVGTFVYGEPQTPKTPVGSGTYVAIVLMVLTLCVLTTCVVVGVYRVRSKRKLKRYIQLN